MELRELNAFVAVVEEAGMSAASRRLHISQPALSQTVGALERELRVKLLTRSSTGVRPTEAGMTLLSEARAILARHDQALRAMARYQAEGGGVVRLGIPLELPPDLLPIALAKFSADAPDTRVIPRHMSTAAQLAAIRSGDLDVGLVRERPPGAEFDAMLVNRENLGVLIASEEATEVVGPEGVRLDALSGWEWVSFPRAASPAWYDELTAILRGHGIDIRPPADDDHELIAPVKFTAVASKHVFALAPARLAHPIPDTVRWAPLVSHPLVRRTWAVWAADSHRRDIGHLITAFELPDPT